MCAYISIVNWNPAKTYIFKNIIEQVYPRAPYIALRMYDTRTSQPITPYFMFKNENVSHSEIRYVWVIWETHKGLCHQFWLFFAGYHTIVSECVLNVNYTCEVKTAKRGTRIKAISLDNSFQRVLFGNFKQTEIYKFVCFAKINIQVCLINLKSLEMTNNCNQIDKNINVMCLVSSLHCYIWMFKWQICIHHISYGFFEYISSWFR